MDNVIDISSILRKSSDLRDGFIFSEVVDGFLPGIGTCAPIIEVFSGGSYVGLSVSYGDDSGICCSFSPAIAMALATALREGAIHAS